jgi:2-methylisocitrate lyase-like PEP mutase family enzyme
MFEIIVPQPDIKKINCNYFRMLFHMGFNTVVYPGSSFFAAAYGIKRVMEEIYNNGAATAFQEQMVKFYGVDEIVGLEKVRKIEDYYLERAYNLGRKLV